MKLKQILLLTPLLLISSTGIQKSAMDSIIQSGTTVTKLADGFLFTEGPTSDKSGNVYFTDQPNDRIMVWSTSGELSTFMKPSGRSNGLSFDGDGNLWACADEKNELWCVSPDRKVTVIPSAYQKKPLNGPNDLWITSANGIFFTDPYYKRPWWNHDSMPQAVQAVYYLAPDHKTITRVIDDLVQPNGIVGSADGKSLFVADIADNKTWKYSIDRDGNLSGKTLFCDMGSDGMTIDEAGNIYLTGKGVSVFDKNGVFAGKIDVPEGWTANVCFGGKDLKTLYITASKSLYSIPTLIKGIR